MFIVGPLQELPVEKGASVVLGLIILVVVVLLLLQSGVLGNSRNCSAIDSECLLVLRRVLMLMLCTA